MCVRAAILDNAIVVMCELCSTEDLTKPKESQPEFRVQIHDITANVGEPATLDCHVIGFPRPEVFWTKASLLSLSLSLSPFLSPAVTDNLWSLLVTANLRISLSTFQMSKTLSLHELFAPFLEFEIDGW